MRIFVFTYMMSDNPEEITAIVPQHVAHWKKQNFEYYRGGPFADRSGGLITFSATNIDEAKRIVSKDPFMADDVLDHYIIKEWLPE
ncbi:MAG: hypothetical protein GTO14_21310 [Anaerolineales bacterium]|nr:hypothetical protein [Anaerolineales bacterium]